jgi:hypothetical protein
MSDGRPLIIPSSEIGASEVKDTTMWRPCVTLACNICGATQRPLRRMYQGHLNPNARICDVCWRRWIKFKEMITGVRQEFDRQIAESPIEHRRRCTHCGKEMVSLKEPPLWCWDCEQERRRIAQQAKSKEEATTHALTN